jgi:hypothetical protein
MAALTLAEAAKLSGPSLQAGIALTIANFDPVLSGGQPIAQVVQTPGATPIALPFVFMNGDQFEYNRENARGGASWLDPDSEINPESATFTNVTVNMRYLYRDIEVPHAFIRGYNDLNNQVSAQLQGASYAISSEFMNAFWYGDNDDNSATPDGVFDRANNLDTDTTQEIDEGGSLLNLSNVDTVLNRGMKMGTDMMVMTRQMRELFNVVVTTSTAIAGTGFVDTNATAGINIRRPVTFYQDVPMYVSDFITFTEDSGVPPVSTSGSQTSIGFLKFGEAFLHGLSQMGGPELITVSQNMDKKDSMKLRLRWYNVPVVVRSKFSVAYITGITSSPITAT